MSIADDQPLPAGLLLDAVQGLLGKAEFSQAALRRCISTAYYALFHLLVADVVEKVAPRTPAGLNLRIARSLAHGEMRDACSAILRPTLQPVMASLLPLGVSAELQTVAEAFLSLQYERHEADYNLARTYTYAEARGKVERTLEAFENWQMGRNSDEATVFLAALLFAKRWSR